MINVIFRRTYIVRIFYRFRSFFTKIVFVFLMFPVCGNSSEDAIAISRRAILEPGVVPHVNAMVRAADGGFLVVGAIPVLQRGWAIRTDAEGSVQWRYTLSPHDEPPSPGFYPEYFDAIAMPKGDSFLCGRMPILPHAAPALLTHLDSKGKLIQEQILSPADKTYFGGGMERCVPFGEGFVGIGVRLRHETGSPAEMARQNASTYYWIVYFDENGIFLKEIFLKSELVNIDKIDILNTAKDGGLLLVGQRGGADTELVHLSPERQLESKKMLSGQFLAVQPLKEDGFYQFVSSATDIVTIVTLDSEFREIKRLTKKEEAGSVRQAYRLPSGEIVLFGDRISINNYSPRVIYLGNNLDLIEVLPLGSDDEASCCDGATAWVGSGDVFVNARSSLKRQKGLIHRDIEAVGAIIDFVKLK